MNALKKLMTLKPKQNGNSDKSITKEASSIFETNETYYSKGYNDSLDVSGDASVLETCLDDIFQKYKDRCSKDNIEQQKLKEPEKQALQKKNTELNKLEAIKEIKENEIAELDKKNKNIDADIAQVKIDPDKYGIDANSKPKAQFYIGLLVLIPITIYLIVFYMSASYSAFFKMFETDALQAIFDANAFSKALKDGFLESIFVSTIPFAFMGLGYLIHMFQRDKKAGKYKIAILLIITFIFDLILAYQIELKIYNFNRTLESADFNLQIAFQKPEFWGIIFAGFVVYIIWGLVFDFIMKEYDNFDKINAFINKLKEDKENNNIEIKKITKLINDVKLKITQVKSEIKEIQSVIDGFVFPTRKYLLLFTEYTKGWYIAIGKEIALPTKTKEVLIQKCKEISQKHLEKNKLTNDVENTIYANNL